MSGLVNYPFQLRRDCWVHLRLPSDITRAEIDKIVEWLIFLTEVPVTTQISARSQDE